jgi:hypothetical protein
MSASSPRAGENKPSLSAPIWMSRLAEDSGSARATLIEWHARCIADPVRRLRYLQAVTRVAATPGSTVRRRLPPGLRVACCLTLLLIPLQSVAPVALPQPDPVTEAPAVWLIEKNGDHEFYSNGLRIETRFAVETRRRLYAVFERNQPDLDAVDWRSDPAGIVYHATESDLVPLEPEETARLRRVGEDLLGYIQRRNAYHFVIDRFGRVYRVVAESDAANHAGHSVWADQQWLYVNLNAAFLGVAFEARTEAGKSAPLEAAQIQAGRLLTVMLRSRYRIASEDCITHAQVSVNPRNREIGYHTDWAADFPYAAMGLADNYRLPVPAVSIFGFGYEPAFLAAAGGRLWPGLTAAENSMREQATARGFSIAGYARRLQQRYLQKIVALETKGALEETSDE